MVRKLHDEHEKLVSSAFHPGYVRFLEGQLGSLISMHRLRTCRFVRTGMGYLAAKEWRLGREPWLTVQQCVDGILPQVRM